MSYFSKLWNKWFGPKPSGSVSSQSTVSASSGVGTPSVSTAPSTTKTKAQSRTASQGQRGAYYDESPSSGVDPLTVAIVVNSLNNSDPVRTEEAVSASTPSEPSSHLSPYESNASGHSHVDSPASSHYDSGYSHSDHSSHSSDHGHSSYDSGSSHSSYDSGSSYSSSDSGGGGGCDGGGGGGD